MAYGDDVLRLRREIRSLKKQLGDKVASGNEDVFGPRPVRGHELEELQREMAVLTRRLGVERDREEVRARAYHELGIDPRDDPDPVSPKQAPRKPSAPDNSDVLMSSKEDQEEFHRRGGG